MRALALAALLVLSTCGGETAAAPVADVLPPAELAAPLEPVLAIDAELTAAVSARIEAAIACAVSESGGRARRSDVRVSVHVRDIATGEIVLARDDERGMRPASCLKLVTTAAALVLLGPAWTFETGFDALGRVQGGVLEGDLVVRAGGDPLYAGEERGAARARLDEAAQALALQGLREVRGDLVLDLGTWADPAPAPEWPDPGQHWQEYCALASGLTANAGILSTRVRPAAVGARARIEVWPAAHGLPTRYGTTTVAGSINDVRVGATRSAVTVAGRIGGGLAEVEAQFAHPDPVLLFESVLIAALRDAGIALHGRVRRERGVTPGGSRLYSLRSPLATTLEPINTHSVNSVADQVFLAVGAEIAGRATRDAGRTATAIALERLGVSAEGLEQVDGSGLSRANRVSTRQLAALLAAVLTGDERTRETYLASLAVAGRSGTLENRMRGGPAEGRVFAKTGWIAGTSSLAGLARGVDGREYAFAILVEYPAAASGLNTRCFKPMHDSIAELLVRRSPPSGGVR